MGGLVWRNRGEGKGPQTYVCVWVVVKNMVLFWVRCIIRHIVLGDPKGDYRPYTYRLSVYELRFSKLSEQAHLPQPQGAKYPNRRYNYSKP